MDMGVVAMVPLRGGICLVFFEHFPLTCLESQFAEFRENEFFLEEQTFAQWLAGEHEFAERFRAMFEFVKLGGRPTKFTVYVVCPLKEGSRTFQYRQRVRIHEIVRRAVISAAAIVYDKAEIAGKKLAPLNIAGGILEVQVNSPLY